MLSDLYSYITTTAILHGASLADAVMLVGTVDVVFGSVDLYGYTVGRTTTETTQVHTAGVVHHTV